MQSIDKIFFQHTDNVRKARGRIFIQEKNEQREILIMSLMTIKQIIMTEKRKIYHHRHQNNITIDADNIIEKKYFFKILSLYIYCE